MNRALADFSLSELEQQFAAWGARPSHAARVLRAYYGSGGEFELTGRTALPDGLLARLHFDGAPGAAGCLSSQVGCAMGCDFCATAKTGFERNLTAGEMVEQFLALRREARAVGRRVQTVVLMGMGEPLLNLDAVLEAVRRIADNRLGALGWRR